MSRAPVVKINPRRIDRAAIARAAGIISGGGVVAYPTETVYGLGANALNRQAVKRVFQIKGRLPDKPLIVLVRNRRELRTLVKEVPSPAKRLMDRFWPDGLTLVFEASENVPIETLGGGTSIALRISQNRIVRALLDEARVPLTSPSANLAGHVPPTAAGEVQTELGGRIDLILDGGGSSQNVPSTILDVRQEPARLLREGRVALREIQRLVGVDDLSSQGPTASLSILLVCTGNTCRSAMAAGLLRKLLRAAGGDHITVRSAGIHATDDLPASRWALRVAQAEDGIDLSRHRSHRLSEEVLDQADLILTMSLPQAVAIERLGRQHARKTYLLTAYLKTGCHQAEDIQDPMGRGQEVYLRTYRLIKDELERILPVLINAPKSRS